MTVDLEGSSHDLIEALSWNLSQRTEEIHVNPYKENQCSNLDLSWASPKYKSETLRLDQSVNLFQYFTMLSNNIL
jgi:hypothetical protein